MKNQIHVILGLLFWIISFSGICQADKGRGINDSLYAVASHDKQPLTAIRGKQAQDSDNIWLYWDSGVNHYQIGTGYPREFAVAARFYESDLVNLSSFGISKISFFPSSPIAQYSVSVWQGSDPPQLIYSQPVENVQNMVWNTVDLSEIVEFSINEPLWIGYQIVSQGGYPAGTDAGPVVAGKGNMLYWDGEWVELTALNSTLTYNWNIRACLVTLADAQAPAQPSNFSAVANPQGQLQVTLSWNNPTLSFGGQELTSLQQVVVERDNAIIHTINDPQQGNFHEFVDPTIEDHGMLDYRVYGVNESGNGHAVRAKLYAGHDVPQAVTEFLLQEVDYQGYLSWTPPQEGFNNGFYDTSSLLYYQITRHPDGVSYTANAQDTDFTDNNIPHIGTYSYTIVPINHMGAGGSATSNPLLLKTQGAVLMYSGQVTTCSGWFYDSGGPDQNYQNNENKILTFFPSEQGGRLRFRFTDFHVEPDFDMLMVYNGPQVNQQNLIGNFSGISVPAILQDLLSTHSSGALTFSFISDDNFTMPGWKASFECVLPMEKNIEALRITGNQTPDNLQGNNYMIRIRNLGTQAQVAGSYTIEIRDDNNNILASEPGPALNPLQAVNVTINYKPTVEGLMKIKGFVNMPGDGDQDNNSTPFLPLIVLGSTFQSSTIGLSTELPNVRAPFDFRIRNNMVQVIYFPDEIQLSRGRLTGLRYYYNFTSHLINEPVRIYVANTQKNNLSEGFIPGDQFTLVFEGNLNFPATQNSIYIPFDEEFFYTGGNLVIMTNNKFTYPTALNNELFYNTYTQNKPLRMKNAESNTIEIDPLNPQLESSPRSYVPRTTMFINTQGLGSISGIVTDISGEPLQGVRVNILGSSISQLTASNGLFDFQNILPGTYDLDFSRFGYLEGSLSQIEVQENQNTTISFAMTAVNEFELSGIVKGDDNLPKSGAWVMLRGYDNYQGYTDEQGVFHFESVYESPYTIEIRYPGFLTYLDEDLFIGEDTGLGIIELETLVITPFNLVVETNGVEDGQALLTWNNGQEQFFDSFETNDFSEWDKFIQGPGTPGFLGKAYWHTTNQPNGQVSPDGYYVAKADWGYDIDTWLISPWLQADENTGVSFYWYSNYFYSVFPNPNGKLTVKVSLDGGATWEEMWNWQKIGPWNNWTWYHTTVDLSFYSGHTIKVAVHLEGNDNALVQLDKVVVGDFSRAGTLAVSSTPQADPLQREPGMEVQGRPLMGHNIFLNNNLLATPATGNEYLFEELEEGIYTAGVQAVYPSGVTSIIESGFEIINSVPLSLSISTNSGDSPQGAEVSLFNHNPGGINYTSVVPENGELIMQSVKMGNYRLIVSLGGFENFVIETLVLTQATSLEVFLVESITAPQFLMIETLNQWPGNALMKWNESDTIKLYQHDGTMTTNPTAYYQHNNRAYGSVFDLSVYPDAVISHIDFFHLHWGLPAASYPYIIHVVDWSTYESMATFGPLNTRVHNSWETEIVLNNIEVSGRSQVAVLLQPLGHLPTDAYPSLIGDATGPSGLSVNASVNNFSDFIVTPALGDFYLNLWIKTAYGTQKSARMPLGFDVYLDDLENPLVSNVQQNHYLFKNLSPGNYTAGVTASYTTGVSQMATRNFQIDNNPGSRIQVIHNSADPNLAELNFFVNDSLLLNQMSFRHSTSFLNVPSSEVSFSVGVGKGEMSKHVDFDYTLQQDKSYVLIINGHLDNTGFNPYVPISLDVVSDARESATNNQSTDFFIFHGATDASEMEVSIQDITSSIFYRQHAGYYSLAADDYEIQFSLSDDPDHIYRYIAPFASGGMQGKATAILLNGFVNPENNNSDEQLGLWYVGAEAGPLISLEAALSSQGPEIPQMQLFPNPASEKIVVRNPSIIIHLEIMDYNGRHVYRESPGQNQVEINLRNLRSGVYFLKIISEDHSQIEKFVIHK